MAILEGGTTQSLGDLLTMVINNLLIGLILQVDQFRMLEIPNGLESYIGDMVIQMFDMIRMMS